MEINLLDASLAGLAELLLIIGLIVVTIIEWIVLLIMKFNPPGKSLLDSFLVNLCSFGVGYLLTAFSVNISLGGDNYTGLLLSFIVTLVVEGLVLQILNKTKPPKTVWITNLVMNVVTYIGLLIIFML